MARQPAETDASNHASALSTLRIEEKSWIILGDTLVGRFSRDEVETIFAYELGCQVNGDIPLGIVLQMAVTLVGLYLYGVGMQAGVRWLAFVRLADDALEQLIDHDYAKQRFLGLAAGVARLYRAILPDLSANKYGPACAVFVLLANKIRAARDKDAQP